MTPVGTESTTYNADYEAVLALPGESLRDPAQALETGGRLSTDRGIPALAVAGISRRREMYVFRAEPRTMHAARWQAWSDRQRAWNDLSATSSGILSLAEHVFPGEGHFLDGLLQGWVERTAEVDPEDDEPAMELSWISLGSRRTGRPLPPPVSLSELPRSRPTVRFQFAPEDD